MLSLVQGTGEEVSLVVGSTLEHSKYLWMLNPELTSESRKACCHRLRAPFPEILTQDVQDEPGGCVRLTDFQVLQRLLLSGPVVAQHE